MTGFDNVDGPASDAVLSSLQPRALAERLATPGAPPIWTVDGVVLSADISGFTRLAERLAKLGVRQAAEALNETINRCFEPMIDEVLELGGDVLKFGGDAIFAIFDGPASAGRAATAAARMQRQIGLVDLGESGPLSMTVGVADGMVELSIAGTARRELLVHGPVVDRCLQLESDAEPGETLIAPGIAAQLPPSWVVEPEPGILSLAPPAETGAGFDFPDRPEPQPARAPESGIGSIDWDVVIGDNLAPAIEAYIGTEGEIRLVTVAFVYLPTIGLEPSAAVAVVERAMALADDYGTTFLSTDVATGGVKMLLAAGAPVAGDGDEDAMLATVSQLVLHADAPPMRAGVNRGLVYAGFLGSPRCRTLTVMGDPTNLAARLLGKAEDRSVAVSQDVLDNARSRYRTAKLSPVLVKGRIEPVTVHRLEGLDQPSRARRHRPRLAGRQAELAALREAMDGARQGRGSYVSLSGEAGIGVTRLLDEFLTALPAGVLRFDVSGTVAFRATPYRAVRSFFRSLAGIDEDLDRAEAGELLTAWVERTAPDMVPWLPLIAPPFDAEVPPTPEAEALDPEFRQQRLCQLVTSLAERALAVPTVLVAEVVAWIDVASRELLRAMSALCPSRPWLVVTSSRPGGPTLGRSEDEVGIGPLSGDEVEAIIGEVGDLPDGRRRELAARSGGNPLYAIELATAAGEGRRLDSIEGLVTARIDRLGHESRVLARTAAVLGERFELDLLDEIVGYPVGDQLSGLGQLIIDRGDGWGQFRSGVVREVAYEGLSSRRRRELHAAVAEALEARGGDVASLAHHSGLAQDYDRCWDYSLRSSERAFELGMMEESSEHLRRAIDVADRTGDAGPPPSAVTEALVQLFDVGVAAKNYPEAMAAGRRAIDRLDQGLERTKLLVRVAMTAAEIDGSYEQQTSRLTDELAALEADVDTGAARAWVGGTLAALHYRGDRVDEALASADRALAAAAESGETAAVPRALLIRHNVLTDRSAPDRFAVGRELIASATEVDDLRILSTAHNNVGLDHQADGDWRQALEHYQAALDWAERLGDGYRAMLPAINRGSLLIDQGRWDEARALIDERRREAEHHRNGLVTAWTRLELGRLEVHAGRAQHARPWLTSALEWLVEAGVESMAYETRLLFLAADLADGLSAAVLEGATDLSPPDDPPAGLAGQFETIVGYGHLQQGRPEEGWDHLEQAVTISDEVNRYGHALALVGRGEAEQFLGRARAARRTRVPRRRRHPRHSASEIGTAACGRWDQTVVERCCGEGGMLR